jgi:hypothetical protein
VTLIFEQEKDPYTGREEIVLRDTYAGRSAPTGLPTRLATILYAKFPPDLSEEGRFAELSRRRELVWSTFHRDVKEVERRLSRRKKIPLEIQYANPDYWSEDELGPIMGRWATRESVVAYLDQKRRDPRGSLASFGNIVAWSDAELEEALAKGGPHQVIWLPGFWDRFARAVDPGE